MSSGQPVSRVRVGPLDAPARAALADLLGLDRLPGEYATVSVSRLDAVLRTALGVGVADVVERLVGPPADRAGDRRRAAAERAKLWEWLERHPVVAAAAPSLPEWAAAVRRGGLVGGTVAETRRELERALAVLAELPAPGLPLPVFAERVLGDPHGLGPAAPRTHLPLVRALLRLAARRRAAAGLRAAVQGLPPCSYTPPTTPTPRRSPAASTTRYVVICPNWPRCRDRHPPSRAPSSDRHARVRQRGRADVGWLAAAERSYQGCRHSRFAVLSPILRD
jgi:hypothetical protein